MNSTSPTSLAHLVLWTAQEVVLDRKCFVILKCGIGLFECKVVALFREFHSLYGYVKTMVCFLGRF